MSPDKAAPLDEAIHCLLSSGTGTAPLAPQALLRSLHSPPHLVLLGSPLTAQAIPPASSQSKHKLLWRQQSKVSVQCVHFPNRWLVLGNAKPGQLACPGPHVLTTAFANPFKTTQMMLWGRDKVLQTGNWLLQLALVSDQTHRVQSKLL